MTKRLHELDAYLTGEHANPDAFDEAMFDAPDDPDLAFFDRLSRIGSKLVAHGTWEMGCEWSTIQALIDKGFKVQVSTHQPGPNRVDLEPGIDFLVTKLVIPPTTETRVDVEIDMPAMQSNKTIREVMVVEGGVLYGLCERPLAQLAYGAGRSYVKIRECNAERRLLAEFAFNLHLS